MVPPNFLLFRIIAKRFTAKNNDLTIPFNYTNQHELPQLVILCMRPARNKYSACMFCSGFRYSINILRICFGASLRYRDSVCRSHRSFPVQFQAFRLRYFRYGLPVQRICLHVPALPSCTAIKPLCFAVVFLHSESGSTFRRAFPANKKTPCKTRRLLRLSVLSSQKKFYPAADRSLSAALPITSQIIQLIAISVYNI